MTPYDSLIPVNVLTGFLGSGKTTLLQRLLDSPDMANTAVLINEFGEVGLDHLLLQRLDEEIVILQSGCVCCTIRGDLSNAIRDLFDRRDRGEVPRFDRLAIETTGLADPAPIVSTLVADPVLRHHFRLGNVVTTVDGVHGAMQLAANPEPRKQIAVADHLVVTKSDISTAADLAALRAELGRINPAAGLHDGAAMELRPNDLFCNDLYDPATKSEEVGRWLKLRDVTPDPEDSRNYESQHSDDIHAFAIVEDRPLDWTAFGLWLSMLLNRHGENVLRVKGILNVVDAATPVVVHGVQSTVHPPAHLDSWPSDDHRSRIVFIVRGLDATAIKRSLAAFNGLANDRHGVRETMVAGKEVGN